MRYGLPFLETAFTSLSKENAAQEDLATQNAAIIASLIAAIIITDWGVSIY